MPDSAAVRRCGVVTAAVYLALALLIGTEQAGRTTNDTLVQLTEDPGGFLARTLSLWNPQVALGELQNQAYGYLFPHGSYFALMDWVGVPAWISQRVWSVLVLLLACEGLRRLARNLHVGPWAASAAGLAYGLAPRHLTEIGVRSAEILPAAALPWVLLPVVQAIDGRRRPRDAAVLSAAAVAFAGGVNGTATAAPLGLVMVVIGWAVLTRRLSWRFAAGWSALVAAVCVWWVASLVRLGAYSPPFFDYVEDARTTTAVTGAATTLRGATHWAGYVVVGGDAWWPAGYQVAYVPWVVFGAGLLAIVGVLGLLRFRGPFRGPLLVAAALGLICQVIAHSGALGSPFAEWWRDLLDGPLAPLRNVSKADPILRVPLALGVGAFVDELLPVVARRWRAAPRRRQVAAGGVAAAIAVGLVAMANPVVQGQTRTPGWDRIPDYWHEAAQYLDERRQERVGRRAAGGGGGVTWVVPGSGFATQRWGWTMEETMHAVGASPWVTRSQVPLTPAATIRLLSALENYLETGSGSPRLADMLTRIGVETVLLRHDLDPQVSDTIPTSTVASALARSPGLERVATFGALRFGPAIELFDVDATTAPTARTGGYDVRDLADVRTVAGSVEDALAAVDAGLIHPAAPMVLAGTPGWDRAADVIGDGYRLRERDFGRVHDAVGGVMTADEPARIDRLVTDYPGPVGADPVAASYDGIVDVTASTSAGWADARGPIHPEHLPWAALDRDLATSWRPAAGADPQRQWLRVRLSEVRTLDRIVLREPVATIGLSRVEEWRVSAGGRSVIARSDPFTGRAVARLPGVRADSVLVEVGDITGGEGSIGLGELRIPGVRPTRTLELPDVPQRGIPDLVFAAEPERRSCVAGLLGPDCDADRQRASEESTGIDRTVRLDRRGRWQVRGEVVARSRAATLQLLQAPGTRVAGSSWFGESPTVSPRMAYDADPTTSWIADPRDPRPTLRIDLGTERRLRGLTLMAPRGDAVLPRTAVIRAGGERRRVEVGGTGEFEPLRARRLRISFRGPRPDGRPFGIGELGLVGGRLTEPIDGALESGSVCGLGPPLLVDGRTHRTRVVGPLGAVAAGGHLAVVPCDGTDRLRLRAGEHRIRMVSTEQFQPVRLALRGQDGPDPPTRSRWVSLLERSDTSVTLRVSGGEDAVLSAAHNTNPGWVATVDGEVLEPLVVDGWAQGWVVPAGTSGEVQLSYQPQRAYLAWLASGLLLLGAVLLAALWILVRRRLGPSATSSCSSWRDPAVDRGDTPGTVARVAALVVAGGLGWLVGGPLVAGAVVAGVLSARRPDTVRLLTGAALAVALAGFLVELSAGPTLPAEWVDLLTASALGFALAAALARGRHTRAEPAR